MWWRGFSKLPSVPSVCFSTQSNATLGLLFELETIKLLSRLRFDLAHAGGAHDGGIDFQGSWLPFPEDGQRNPVKKNSSDSPIRVVGQCKAISRPVGVHALREIEGVLQRQPFNTLGVFVSRSGYSTPSKRFINQSKLPIILASLTPQENHNNSVEHSLVRACGDTKTTPGECDSLSLSGFVLNRVAARLLPRLSVGTRRRHTWTSNSLHNEAILQHSANISESSRMTNFNRTGSGGDDGRIAAATSWRKKHPHPHPPPALRLQSEVVLLYDGVIIGGC